MRRLVIAVLHSDHKPWRLSSNWKSAECMCNNQVIGYRFCDVDVDNKVIFLLQTQDTTNNVNVVIKQYASQYNKIYVAAHQGSVRWDAFGQITAGADFNGIPNDPIYSKLCRLVSQPNTETLDELCETIKKKYAFTLVPHLTTLKHHLVFLFLPIDIDAQGLIEAKGDAQYWGDAGNPYTNEKLKNLWEQAKQLVYGDGQQDAVKKVVNEAKEKASNATKEKICQAWEKVTTLLPDNEPPEVITQIFQDLGEAGSVDLKKLTCHWKQFHDWLIRLCEAMDKLRDEVEKAEQEKQGGKR